MKKTYAMCRIREQKEIASGIFSLWLEAEEIAGCALPGQFVTLYCEDKSRLLPRPISICEADPSEGLLRLVYRVTGPGTGTEEFSRRKAGDCIRAAGPFGNGFPLDASPEETVLLTGGGIGIPPLLETAKRRTGKTVIVLGYRDELFLKEEFEKYGEVYVATEDGSAGTRGNVMDAIREHGIRPDRIFACGPRPMLRALKEYAVEKEIPCWISMEERMACGVGACLGCVCTSEKPDPHSLVNNKRICRDGPVFSCTEVTV